MTAQERQMSRTERKKEQRKQEIITVAMELFQRDGFDETSMERIAEEADIAKGTLYNYFPEKEAIVAAEIRTSMRMEMEGWLKTLRTLPDTTARIFFIIKQLMLRVQGNKEVFARYMGYRMKHMIALEWDFEESVKSGVGVLGEEMIRLGRQKGEIRDDIPLRVLEASFEFNFLNLVKEYYHDSEAFELDKSIMQCADIFLNGVGK